MDILKSTAKNGDNILLVETSTEVYIGSKVKQVKRYHVEVRCIATNELADFYSRYWLKTKAVAELYYNELTRKKVIILRKVE